MTAWRVAPATASTLPGARAPRACGDDPKAIEQNSRLAECSPLVQGVAEDRLVYVQAPVRSHGVRPSVLLRRRVLCFGGSMVRCQSCSKTTGLTRSLEYPVRPVDMVVLCASGVYRREKCTVPMTSNSFCRLADRRGPTAPRLRLISLARIHVSGALPTVTRTMPATYRLLPRLAPCWRCGDGHSVPCWLLGASSTGSGEFPSGGGLARYMA